MAPGAAGGADPAAAGAPAGGSGTEPAWTLDAAELAPKWGEVSTALEEKRAESTQRAALDAVKLEFPRYFEAIQKHPRLLIGEEVPAIGKDGTEKLRDSDDAREWQEAVKALLVDEVRERASRNQSDDDGNLQVLHQSIELFQNNADLVPGTRQFDRELATRFTTLAKPYELRVDGKLYGYSIPAQPLIEQLRAQITTERAAAPIAAQPTPPSVAGAPAAAEPVNTQAPAEPPQAGIPAKAGTSAPDAEGFGALFGTIGLPNFRI